MSLNLSTGNFWGNYPFKIEFPEQKSYIPYPMISISRSRSLFLSRYSFSWKKTQSKNQLVLVRNLHKWVKNYVSRQNCTFSPIDWNIWCIFMFLLSFLIHSFFYKKIEYPHSLKSFLDFSQMGQILLTQKCIKFL